MERKLMWLHIWDDGTVTHVSIQRGDRYQTYTPSRGLAEWLSNIAFNWVATGHGKFSPSTVGLGWSWSHR